MAAAWKSVTLETVDGPVVLRLTLEQGKAAIVALRRARASKRQASRWDRSRRDGLCAACRKQPLSPRSVSRCEDCLTKARVQMRPNLPRPR